MLEPPVLRDNGEQGHVEGIAPLPFQKGCNTDSSNFIITVSQAISSWLMKIELKQIYCSYSHIQRIQDGFL